MAHNDGSLHAWPGLTIIEYYILVALLNRARHGIGIFEEVARRTNQKIILIPGTLYTALKRMYGSGWIEVTEPPPAEQAGDDRRKFYQLTEAGHTMVNQQVAWMDAELQQIRSDLEHADLYNGPKPPNPMQSVRISPATKDMNDGQPDDLSSIEYGSNLPPPSALVGT